MEEPRITNMGRRLLSDNGRFSTRNDLGRALIRTCLLHGEFRLRSGRTSAEYFDKYRFESEPELLHSTACALEKLLPENTQALAGLELGGVPLATALAMTTGIPAVFVRKSAKDYGTRGFVEGGNVAGKRIVIIEDVITSGGQILESSAKLKEAAAEILAVLCVVDRRGGGNEALAAAGLKLHALFSFNELRDLNSESLYDERHG